MLVWAGTYNPLETIPNHRMLLDFPMPHQDPGCQPAAPTHPFPPTMAARPLMTSAPSESPFSTGRNASAGGRVRQAAWRDVVM